MKTQLIAAAVFAVASSAAFAETGVKLNQIDSVTNVYGRAAVATVKVRGDLQTAGAQVDTSGRQIVANQGTTINAGSVGEGGRS